MTELLTDLRKENILRLAINNKRLDGRKLDEYRKIRLETNINENAEGSAQIFLGDTRVMTGVKMQIGEPYPDSPDSGMLSVTAELVPLASPTFEVGPPREEAIELARVVDRGIRESKCIDLEKLVLESGKKVWAVFVDLWVLNYDGNLIDASSLAALAALQNTKFPAVKLEDGEYVPTGEYTPLPMKDRPISCTTVKIGDKLLLDPALDEENVIDARVTITTKENGNICAIQKGEPGSFTEEELLKAVDLSIETGKKLRKLFT